MKTKKRLCHGESKRKYKEAVLFELSHAKHQKWACASRSNQKAFFLLYDEVIP